MQTEQQRIDWLKRQLVQVEEFLQHGKERLALTPDNKAMQVTQQSWERLHAEYTQDLAALEAAQ